MRAACALLAWALPASALLMPPCPLASGAPVGGVAGQFIDINHDGKPDIVYSFSKGDIPGGGGGEPGTYTALATFLNTGRGGFCLHYQYPQSDFFRTWYQIVGRCVDNVETLYPPCNTTEIATTSLLIPPCAMSAYYTQTPNTVQHGQFIDINLDGYPDVVYAYGEGSGDSALATFLNVNGTGFCNLVSQEVLADQCMDKARDRYPPCDGAAHSNRSVS
eukprot:TRINITY_DN47790_c0_g1_i1.p1 TRINITY_DN47790_c0_g1~~TRINITY_DN47790_c0_g1_i1.p1  ORF type:complete len:246 (+),score=62.09 TRINITY_DN47790_c0_g1_i1:82-738(+)